MNNSDYPGIFEAADNASSDNQRTYISRMRADLLMSISGAALAIYNFETETSKLYIYVLSALLLFFSLILTLITKNQRKDDFWYQGRALAESAKTLTWRYVTCSDNFENNLTQMQADRNFIDGLTHVMNLFPALISELDQTIANRPIISPEMTRVRSLSWQDRLSYYIKHRISDQKDWYVTKAEYNKKRKKRWFWVIISFQAGAVLSSFSLIFYPQTSWNLVGLFTTVASSGIAWLELKQHQSLIQAYSTAAIELSQIEQLQNSVIDESSLAKYVLDSENAISREHTLWQAQRRK